MMQPTKADVASARREMDAAGKRLAPTRNARYCGDGPEHN